MRPFRYGEAIERAERALAAPPPLDWIRRPKTVGVRVAVFALPLELLRPQNRTRHAPAWMLAKLKKEVFLRLLVQLPETRREPLTGRPQVICVRFSSNAPDAYNDGFKAAIDALCVPRGRRKAGLCFLADDSPKCCDIHQHWEPAKKGEGFGLIQIFTGEAAAIARRTG